MTGSFVPTVVALSLGNLVALKGTSVLKNAPPPIPPANEPSLLSSVQERWFRVSSLVRFFVSGNLGNICFFFIERTIFSSLSQLETLPDFVETYKETVSFFVGYLLQIITQHFLHALLVYGLESINTREKYFKTLLGQFYAYGIALFGSTTLNLFLIKSGIEKTVAFFSTMVIFACINYYLIGWLVKRALQSTTATLPNEIQKSGTKEGRNMRPFQRRQTNSSETTSVMNSKRNNDIRKIHRGGAFGVGQELKIALFSHQSVHQMVVQVAPPIDIDSVNQQLLANTFVNQHENEHTAQNNSS